MNRKLTKEELTLIDNIADEYNWASECYSTINRSDFDRGYSKGVANTVRGLLTKICAEYDLKIQNYKHKGETGEYNAARVLLPEERSQNGASVQRDLRNIRVILED